MQKVSSHFDLRSSVSGAAGTKKTENVGCQCTSHTLSTIVFFTVIIVGQVVTITGKPPEKCSNHEPIMFQKHLVECTIKGTACEAINVLEHEQESIFF